MIIDGKISIAIDRVPYLANGYATYAWLESKDTVSIAHLGEIKFTNAPDGICEKRTEHPITLTREALRTIYEEFREQLINHGLIPRPLIEDEVKALRDQLRDTQKTRDRLLEIIEKLR